MRTQTAGVASSFSDLSRRGAEIETSGLHRQNATQTRVEARLADFAGLDPMANVVDQIGKRVGSIDIEEEIDTRVDRAIKYVVGFEATKGAHPEIVRDD